MSASPWLLALGLTVAVSAGLGCSASARTARGTAQRDFGCSDLQVDKRSHDSYLVRGCGRTGIYQCPEAPGQSHRFCVNLALLARQRAAAEFRCDIGDVAVEELVPYIFRTTGCDLEAVYHCEASDGRPRCLLERGVDDDLLEAARARRQVTPAGGSEVVGGPADGT